MSTTTLPRLTHPVGAGRVRTLVRGRTEDPAWVRPALLGLLAAAAFVYLYKLTASGYSNPYYASAVKSASVSLKAWFFGSLDPGSFITVDKPPLSIWLMGLSARAFGFSSFSLLLPQALCTLATVGLLFTTVRRAFGPVAGVLAAAMLVLSPVTLALARVDMPDPLLVLLLVASGWATLRAVESGRTKHLVWAGVFVGLAFMTKMLQGWMVVPALAATYLFAGTPRLAVRLRQLRARRPRDGRGVGGVAARRVAVAGLRALHRRLDRRLGVGPDPRLQRLRADLRRGHGMGGGGASFGGLRGGGGCSTRRSAARSRGCCRWRRSACPPGCGSRAGGRGPTSPAPAGSSSASGRSSTPSCSASRRARSTRTT
jgi:hypothetical protein